MGKIIVIGSIRGGVGKTTTTYNLANALSKLGKKILIVDFDFQAVLTHYYGTEHPDKLEYTIGHLMMAQIEGKIESDLERYICNRDGVDYIPASIYLLEVEERLQQRNASQTMLANVLEPLREKYDYILIDTCPSFSTLTVNALAAADEVILLAVPQWLEIMGLREYEQMIEKVKAQFNPKLEIAGVLLTRCEENRPSDAIVEDVKACFEKDVRVFETVIEMVVDEEKRV